MGRASFIDVLEAAYDVDATDRAWLRGILAASTPLLDEGLGLVLYGYDVSDPEHVKVPMAAGTSNLRRITPQYLAAGIASTGPGYIRDTYRTLPVATSSETPGYEGTSVELTLRSLGIADLLGINGLDPSGTGLWLGAGRRAKTRAAPIARARYARIASHLANSYRLRRRLAGAPASGRSAPWGAEAVLSARGTLEHCGNDDVLRARERLRESAVIIDRARGKRRSIAPDAALADWLGLVDGRWTLVDKFDRDGKRYVLARGNAPQVRGLALLTERERAVVGYAAIGHSNKLIAYDLGIAVSTVRVLVARAGAKLGARSREDLVAAVRAALDANALSVEASIRPPRRT